MSFLSNPLVIAALILAGLATLNWLARRLLLIARREHFAGKVVLITGASRGFGRELAHMLAAKGARLALASRKVDQLNAVADECRAINPQVEALVTPTDVTDDAQLERLIAATLERFGRLDILISNAGIIQGGAIAGGDFASIRRQMDVNLIAAMRLTQLALPHMLAQGQGHIVFMASAAGRHTAPYYTAYGVTKHGLVGFGEGLRRELMGTGLRVLLVNPGFADTDITAMARFPYQKMGFHMIPVRRVARRTLEGITLGVVEVNIGWLEWIGGLASLLTPRLGDLFWRALMPRDFAEVALKQRTE